MRIAIVNDLSLAVEALRRVVESVPGQSVAWVARDGAEAVELVRKTPADFLVLDISMPVMDGKSALAELRRENKGEDLVSVLINAEHHETVFQLGIERGRGGGHHERQRTGGLVALRARQSPFVVARRCDRETAFAHEQFECVRGAREPRCRACRGW